MRSIFITIRPDSINGKIRSSHVSGKTVLWALASIILVLLALLFTTYFMTTSYFKALNVEASKARELKKSINNLRSAKLSRQEDIEAYTQQVSHHMKVTSKLIFLLGMTDEGAGGGLSRNIDELQEILSDLDIIEQRYNRFESFSSMFELLPIQFPLESKFKLSSSFGMRRSPFSANMEMHSGIDLSAKMDSVILAAGSGTVQYAGRWNEIGKPSYAKLGLFVQIKHGDSAYISLYGHCSRLLVKAGDIVKAGQPVALVGSTGWSTAPHLHFAILHNQRFVDPTFYLLKFDADLFFNAVIVDNDATLVEE